MNRQLISRRNAEIRRAVLDNGQDLTAVARAFDLSRRSIYNILAKFDQPKEEHDQK
jgi:hypothetical protein